MSSFYTVTSSRKKNPSLIPVAMGVLAGVAGTKLSKKASVKSPHIEAPDTFTKNR